MISPAPAFIFAQPQGLVSPRQLRVGAMFRF